MKKLIASLALCMLSAVLYGGFGAMCAFAYMAVDDSQMEDVKVQTSPAFAFFLHDSSRKSAEFTRQELQDGVAGFLFACARQKKDGVAVVPAVPILKSEYGVLQIQIPSAYSTTIGVFKTCAIFDVNIQGGFKLSSARLGRAIIPSFLRDRFAGFYLRQYSDFIGAKNLSLLSSLKIEFDGYKYKLSK